MFRCPMAKVRYMTLEIFGSHRLSAMYACCQRFSLARYVSTKIAHSEKPLRALWNVAFAIAWNGAEFEMVAHMNFCPIRARI